MKYLIYGCIKMACCKAFTDTDLDPIRKRPVNFDLTLFCPGDACPDLHYELSGDGGILFFHKYPELSGIPGAERSATDRARETGLAGRYTILGTHVLAMIPGMQDDLEQSYPSHYDSYGMGAGQQEKRNAGSPGLDVIWLGAVLDSAGRVTAISR